MCAAFSEEGRMKFTEPIGPNRKSGDVGHPSICCIEKAEIRMPSLRPAAGRLRSPQQASSFFGEVGHGEICAGAANRDERFHDGALPVQPAFGEGSL